MSSLDILYYSLAVGFLAFVAFGCFAFYQLGLTLIVLRRIIEEIQNIVAEILAFKNSLQRGWWSLVARLVGGNQPKGGGGNG